MKITTFVAAAMALALSACAQIPQIPYDRMLAGNIKSVAIPTPGMPKDAAVVLATSAGQSFGLVGAIVDASLQAARDSRFHTMLVERKFSPQEAFLTQLKDRLQTNGYAVSSLAVSRPPAAFIAKYPAEPGVDAFLDLVVTNYGYISAGIGGSTPYRPQFLVKVRLVRATDSAVLMQDTVVYNAVLPVNSSEKAITISPSPEFEFGTFDMLQAQPDVAVKGLQDAVTQSADAVGNLLR